MNIVDRLKQEHEEIMGALNDLLSSPIDDAEKYSKAFLDVMMRVDAHERAEEQTIYQALMSDIQVRPIALQAMEEHRVTRELFKDLADVEITEEVWLPRLVVVNNLIALHVQIEEGNVLPLLIDSYDDNQREKFDTDFQTVEKQVLQQLRS
jgi:hemerythrin superfamily protein